MGEGGGEGEIYHGNFLSKILIVVVEVVRVQESFYRFSKDKISETMTQFLLCDGLEVESLDLLIETLVLYREKNLDLADALLATTALRKGPQSIYSFDHHLDRINGVTRLEPGKKP